MLQAASNISPRGVYVCGNTSTATGLTVTLTKESGNSEYSLEAGALVLGDQGKEGHLKTHKTQMYKPIQYTQLYMYTHIRTCSSRLLLY